MDYMYTNEEALCSYDPSRASTYANERGGLSQGPQKDDLQSRGIRTDGPVSVCHDGGICRGLPRQSAALIQTVASI
jgi:hypothetical protein